MVATAAHLHATSPKSSCADLFPSLKRKRRRSSLTLQARKYTIPRSAAPSLDGQQSKIILEIQSVHVPLHFFDQRIQESLGCRSDKGQFLQAFFDSCRAELFALAI